MKETKDKIIKVAHVLYSFTEIGGLENGVINIINRLDPDRFFHVVCSLTKVGKITNRIYGQNVKYVQINKREGNDPVLPFKLYSVFKREQVDIVHLRNWATLVEGFLGAKAAGIKSIIYSEHGRHFEDAWERQTLKFQVKRFCFSRVDVLLTVSHNLAREMSELYRLERKIHVIPNGVDALRFKPSNSNLPFLQKENFSNNVVGTVCRLDPGKNLDQLIMDMAGCSYPMLLVIAGDGPERSSLEKIVKRKNLDSKVIFLGDCNNIPEVLNSLDLFVLPSKSEGLSNVILEAMAVGLPIVAYDVGGNRELVQHGRGGFLLPHTDRRGFVSAIVELLRDKRLARNMGMFNRELILKNFSIEKMVQSYNELYTSSL